MFIIIDVNNNNSDEWHGVNNEEMENCQLCRLGLDISLFSRLQNLQIDPILLSVQYRMHPDLSTFSSTHFYEGRVISGVHPKQRPEIQGIQWHRANFPAKFINCTAKEMKTKFRRSDDQVFSNEGSYFNPKQCDIVMSCLQVLAYDQTLNHCAVLTPYSAQAQMLKTKVEKVYEDQILANKLVVSTIDGFQGREADLIIVSTVRSNDKGSLGFVKDKRRMNVAITRARRGIIVIGNEDTLRSDQIWSNWIDWAQR